MSSKSWDDTWKVQEHPLRLQFPRNLPHFSYRVGGDCLIDTRRECQSWTISIKQRGLLADLNQLNTIEKLYLIKYKNLASELIVLSWNYRGRKCILMTRLTWILLLIFLFILILNYLYFIWHQLHQLIQYHRVLKGSGFSIINPLTSSSINTSSPALVLKGFDSPFNLNTNEEKHFQIP